MNPFYASNAFIATVKLLAHNNIKFTQLDYAFDSEKQDILKMLPEFDKHKRERLANSITNMIIANKTGADYLPSIETQSMLQMSGMKNAFTRFVVLDSLDMQLSNFYKELNCLLGQDIVSYPFPVLLDYLAKKYSNASDILKAAFELREEKRVISLRCELNELDRAFISGDLLAVRDYLENIKRVVAEITKSKRISRSIDITISFPPAVSITVDIPSRKPFQCVFLKDLAFYGIRERRLNSSLNWNKLLTGKHELLGDNWL